MIIYLMSSARKFWRYHLVKFFSTEEGRAYLINTFQDPEEIENQRFVKELNKSIENEGFQYLDNTINKLNGSAFRNRVVSIACYSGSFLILISFLVLMIVKANDKVLSNDLYFLIWKGIEIVTESALAISASRFLFILGKSFMVEAIRASDRAHAIGLGKLYLQLFKNKFDWNELKDVLQNWNIDKGVCIYYSRCKGYRRWQNRGDDYKAKKNKFLRMFDR